MRARQAAQSVVIDGIAVNVVRKNIKNLHLRISPPHGQVRVTVPFMVRDEAVRTLVLSRLDWIKRHQAKFSNRVLPSPQEMVSGESHFFLGESLRLELIHQRGTPAIQLGDAGVLQMRVRESSSQLQRQKLLQSWYREQMALVVPGLLAKWQPVLKVEATGWGIKKMKSKWGSCNITRRNIWLNLELIKKSPQCLEYVLVHELVHLLEPSHNQRFKMLMDQFMPEWRLHKNSLNQTGIHNDLSI